MNKQNIRKITNLLLNSDNEFVIIKKEIVICTVLNFMKIKTENQNIEDWIERKGV